MKIYSNTKITKKYVRDILITSYFNIAFKVCCTPAYPFRFELGLGLISFECQVHKLQNYK